MAFEKVQPSSTDILKKALDEAETWFDVNGLAPESVVSQEIQNRGAVKWLPPPSGLLKCNVGVVWEGSSCNCGVAWILRDPQGLLSDP